MKKNSFSYLLLFFYFVITSFFYVSNQDFSYDEPHYILGAQSLIQDGDFDLKNNYQSYDYQEYYFGVLDPHVSPNSNGGKWYSIHAYGASIVLVAPFWLAEVTDRFLPQTFFALDNSQKKRFKIILHFYVSLLLSLMLIGSYFFLRRALAALVVDVDSGFNVNVGHVALFALFLSNPILIFSKFFSVEIFGFAFLSFVIFMYFRGKYDSFVKILLPIVSALLVWIHVKFLVLSLGALLVILIRYRRELSVKDFFLGVLIFSIPVIFLLVFHNAFYGSFSLSAQYGEGALKATYLLQALLGYMFDGHTGLLFSAPIYCLALWILISSEKVPKSNDLTLIFLIATLPLVVLGSLHVIHIDQFSEVAKTSSVIESWFVHVSQIPMWFQTPVSRFVFPAVPLLCLLVSLIAGRFVNSKSKCVFVSSLLLASVLLSLLQVVGYPHTLFRPNANFEGFAPIWGLLVGNAVSLVPNLLSFDYPTKNIAAAFFWLFAIVMVFLCLERSYKKVLPISVVILLLGFYVYDDRYQKLVVSPSTLSSNIGTVNENSDKVFFSTRKVTTDLIYGPYVYLLPGRYCLNLNVIVKGDYDLFKWYIADAITDKFYVMNETKLPMDQKVLDDSLCFDNVTPHFPKEIKVYGKDFEGSIRFQELAFSRTPM